MPSFSNILNRSKLLNLFKRLPLKNKLIVLRYQRIRPEIDDFRSDFDDEVYTADVSRFRDQLGWLKDNTDILDEDSLLDAAKSGRYRPGVVITFDGGYRDGYDTVFPILKEMGIPAIFFIPSKLIESRLVGWRDLIAYLFKKTEKKTINYKTRSFDLASEKKKAIRFFQERMKIEKFDKTAHMIDDLHEMLAVDAPPKALQDRELMTWDQLRAMSGSLISFGANGYSSTILATLHPSAQKEELVISKLLLESKLERPVHAVAYPEGMAEDYTTETLILAKNTGHEIGFTCHPGINSHEIENRHAIDRISNFVQDIRSLAALISLPQADLWEKAAATHRRILQEHPDFADFAYRLGLIQLGQGQIAKAIDSFTEAIAHAPSYTQARIKLGIALAYTGQFEKAIDHLEQVLERHPSYADVHYLMGLIFSGKRDFAKAVCCFEKSVEAYPTYKEALVKLGILYFIVGEVEKGLYSLEKAARVDSDDVALQSMLDVARNMLKKKTDPGIDVGQVLMSTFSENGRLFREISDHIEISPNFSDLISIVVNHSGKKETLIPLIPVVDDYIEQYPSYPDLRDILGTLHLKVGDAEKAENAYKSALAISPNYLKAKINLFKTLIRSKKYTDALNVGSEIAAMQLPYPDVYTLLGEVQLHEGMASQAFASVKKAFALNPEYAKAHLLIERIYSTLNDSESDPKAAKSLIGLNKPSRIRSEIETLLAEYTHFKTKN